MRILVLADIHSEIEALSSLLEKIDSVIQTTDLIICPGNVTDMSRSDSDFTQLDFANLVIQKIVGLGKSVYFLPGNHDPYDILTIFDEYGINIHNKTKTFQKTKFIGWGGALTPFNTLFEPTEEETKTHLERLSQHVEKNNFVLVLHNPPKNTKLDKISTGEHVGSPAIRAFIEKEHPRLAITAHIHEAMGEDLIGKTKLFYPGPVFNGNYGIVELTPTIIKCERKQVNL